VDRFLPHFPQLLIRSRTSFPEKNHPRLACIAVTISRARGISGKPSEPPVTKKEDGVTQDSRTDAASHAEVRLVGGPVIRTQKQGEFASWKRRSDFTAEIKKVKRSVPKKHAVTIKETAP
jgi:hypothetical protein